MRIPSHIFYPGMVLALLGMSVIMGFTLVYAARSDGGAQVMPDYYEHAVEWDSEEPVRRHSRALHWSLQLTLHDNGRGSITVLDRNAEPIEGLRGQVHLRRPQFAEDLAVAELIDEDAHAGTYHFAAPAYTPGYWDVVLDAELDGQAVHLSHRQRLP